MIEGRVGAACRFSGHDMIQRSDAKYSITNS